MMKTLSPTLVLSAALLLASACGDDKVEPKTPNDGGGGTITDVREKVKAKLISCDVVDADSAIDLAPIGSVADKCAANCIADASCGNLTDLVCEGGATGALRTCLAGCEFRCTDGTTNEETVQCDGFEDCRNASDELNCDEYYFACGNGDKTSPLDVCDGMDDCGDNSDEQDCPAAFQCTNGTTVPASFKCDGKDGCGDNSDEADCGLSCG